VRWVVGAGSSHTGETCITEPLEWGGGWIPVLDRLLALRV